MQTRPLAIASIACVVAASLNCNARSQTFDPVLTTPPPQWTTATSPTAPGPRFKLEVGPSGGIAPLSGTGRLTLDGPAPDGGLTIALRSTAPAVLQVSASFVTVSPGATTAAFSFTTPAVSTDTGASIVASTPDQTLSSPVAIWAVLPMFYAVAAGEPGLVPPEATLRRTSSSGSSFDAECIRDRVTAKVDGLRLDFQTGDGVALRPGVYENARTAIFGSGNRMPYFLLGYVPNTCTPIGRFEVREVEYAGDGQVKKLWIAFEQGCAGQQGTVRGEVRTAAAPNNPWRNQCTIPK